MLARSQCVRLRSPVFTSLHLGIFFVIDIDIDIENRQQTPRPAAAPPPPPRPSSPAPPPPTPPPTLTAAADAPASPPDRHSTLPQRPRRQVIAGGLTSTVSGRLPRLLLPIPPIAFVTSAASPLPRRTNEGMTLFLLPLFLRHIICF